MLVRNLCVFDCANILGCAPSAVLVIADRASRATVMAIASHSDCTGALNTNNDCANMCTVNSSVRFLIADRARCVTVKAIATVGRRFLMIAPTFLVVHCQQFSDRASKVTVKAIVVNASHSGDTGGGTGF